MGFMALWLLARSDSMRVDIPMTPTLATSPSSNALVACVVEWARKITSLGSTPDCSSTLRKTSTTPLATPRGSAWVVSTENRPTTSWVALSISTALVKVPPTSIPMRKVREDRSGSVNGVLSFLVERPQHQVADRRVDRDHQDSEGQGGFQELAVADLGLPDRPQRPRIGRIHAPLHDRRREPDRIEIGDGDVLVGEHDGEQRGAGADHD